MYDKILSMNILDYTLEKYFNGECELLDAHCHIKKAEGFKLISYGLIPSGFNYDCEAVSDDVYIGLGFHPWAVGEASLNELEIFTEKFNEAKFIGEIGLDFSEKRVSSKDKQLEIFKQIAGLLGKSKNKIVSIHAVNATTDVLDILDTLSANAENVCILHWFSGNSEELKRALDSGYYFSVGPKMLGTNKGREYIRQLPEEKLFIETDLPWDGDELTVENHYNLLNDFAMQLRELKGFNTLIN